MYPLFLPEDADIIIIGAGISGMSAAFYLLEKEPTLPILILEAKPRIGGRTQTLPLRIGEENRYRSFDTGGQFISSSQVHLIQLIHKLNLHLVQPLSKVGKTVWNLDKYEINTITGNPLRLGTIGKRLELFSFFDKIYTLEKSITFNNPHSMPQSKQLDMESMESYITRELQSTSAQNFVRHFIRITCGIEPSEISVLFYLALCNATDGAYKQILARETWIQGGADLICQEIATKIGKSTIKVNDPVIEILRDNYQVLIETENATYVSKYVIIAIQPKEILDIVFTPPLTRTRIDLLNMIRSGNLIKFIVTYKTAFWRENGFNGDIVSCGQEGGYGPIHACYDITFQNSPALTGYIASNDALKQPAETYKEDVLQQLARYFGEEALKPLDYFEKSWLNEPYTYHCFMNSPGFGNMDIFHEIRRPVGRLFWAGTETATHWNGFMGGAVQAGYRAAIEVLYECRPQTLTEEDIKFVYYRRPRKRNIITAITSFGRTNWKVILPTVILIVGFITYKRRYLK